MNEKISIMVTYKNGRRRNYDWYENNTSTLDECFATEEELVWYVLESIAEDKEFDDAVSIEADSVITDRGREVLRLSATVR